jgi:signal peptidase I
MEAHAQQQVAAPAPKRGVLGTLLGVSMAAVVALLSLSLAGIAAAVFWFHLSARPVLSGSMRPTFAPGSVIVTGALPVSQIRAGDIIMFTPPGWSASVAHRVVSVSGPVDHPVISTKGDANPVKDPWHARLNGTTVPEVVASVPWVGWAMTDVAHHWLRAFLIALVGLGVAIPGVRAILRGPGEAEPERQHDQPGPQSPGSSAPHVSAV